MSSQGHLPAGAYAGALAALPGIGPATLHRLLSEAAPADVWDAVRSGEVVRPPARGPRVAGGGPRVPWAEAAARAPLARWWDEWCRRGVEVTWWGDDGRYPERLRTDPEPPGVLFWRGHLQQIGGPSVAVVGTRRCSPDGRAIAYDLGRDLVEAGVCVVSGLALGIDGAAHLGAVSAAAAREASGCTVGVAASGVDVVYPPRHAILWERVVACGAVLSETPPGRPAQAWRFPARNRVIAGLVDMVVVVESHITGGALITADRALDRGIEVRVVPGPVHLPAAAGSNQLLYDGPGPVRDAADVLDALGMLEDRPRRPGRRRPAQRADQLRLTPARPDPPQPDPAQPAAARPAVRAPAELGASVTTPLSALQAAVLEAVDWRPTSVNRVVERTAEGVGPVVGTLEALREAGLVSEDSGWWTRRSTV